ncbi:serine/threonine-protein kinase [Streptomyces lydicamycinicus]|uniref:Serine/threonine-protein kinase n=1 Tax=Streptomyces lydicamycinicus TaxID=1546107 RepID=A0A0P4RAC8_9ACTN|nr:serine/threonine-protein kinase [Streptomyces lydicamycinicus]
MPVLPGVVTVVSTTPAPEGATTGTEVGEVAVMPAGLPPKRTTVAPADRCR